MAHGQDAVAGFTPVEPRTDRPEVLDGSRCPETGESVTAAGHDDVSGGSIEGRPKRFLEAVPGVAAHGHDLNVGHCQIVGNLKGTVRGTVVDDKDFKSIGQFTSNFQKPRHMGLKRRLDIVDRQQDAQ